MEIPEVKNLVVPRPFSVGDELEVTIETHGKQGDGIAKKDGFVLFVKNSKKGDVCRIKVIDVKLTYAIAEKL
ncbi:MAG: TRAM domain-containing protein [Candidatus Micrarchaeota archaeon]